MSAGERAVRSRKAFAERFPHLIDAINAQPAQSSAVLDNGVPVDILVGDRRIYGGDARQHSLTQVEDFLKKPLRLIMEAPTAAGLVSEICIDLKYAMERTLDESGVSELSRGPISAPTFLVVFGLGLGYHLDALISRTGARWVIVVEPFVEFIDHSFRTVDWQAIFERIDDAGGAIHFLSDLDPGRIIGSVMRLVSIHGTPFLDGTWVFTHYPLWTFAEAAKRLHGAAEFAYVNRGFFEDEIVMMTNAVTNFSTHSFWLLDAKPRLHRPETAVVVGAGPSLDEGIETLRRIRDRVVLFSCGTALRPLLRRGLVPDFHCELENGPQVFEVISEAREHGDLSRVCLIASATVDPRVAPLFGEVIFFFRDSVSSTCILRGEVGPINGAAPTCVNTAMAAAEGLGFTDFILFGADCGTRPGMPDHAEGTIYRDIDKWKKYLEQRAKYPLEVEGNFGGVAATNWVYDASRRMLIELIAIHRLNVVNCSDGALIAGATPRVPESLKVEGAAVDQGRILGDLKRTMRHYAPGEILRTKALEGLRERAQALYADLRVLLGRFDRESADFAGLYQAMYDFCRQAGAAYGQTQSIPDGSLHAIPRLGMFYGCRLSDEALRRRLFAGFHDEFGKALDAMERQTDELLARLSESIGEPPASVPAA
ncbi:MAG TPA: 6-hydroxymethylpterin diphosphokinase MptE-like protein [Stellaceae bacterium]|nr:6-hydroxymethylpterin diphosphokinase MptE-like protein [Stellaceae bacterium]